jgi:hypothetical protein
MFKLEVLGLGPEKVDMDSASLSLTSMDPIMGASLGHQMDDNRQGLLRIFVFHS